MFRRRQEDKLAIIEYRDAPFHGSIVLQGDETPHETPSPYHSDDEDELQDKVGSVSMESRNEKQSGCCYCLTQWLKSLRTSSSNTSPAPGQPDQSEQDSALRKKLLTGTL